MGVWANSYKTKGIANAPKIRRTVKPACVCPLPRGTEREPPNPIDRQRTRSRDGPGVPSFSPMPPKLGPSQTPVEVVI